MATTMLRVHSLVDDSYHDLVYEQARNLKHSCLKGIGWRCVVLDKFGGEGGTVRVTGDDGNDFNSPTMAKTVGLAQCQRDSQRAA